MKLCFMAFKSIHTERCLKWFVKRGHEVFWITQQPDHIEGVRVFDLSFTPAGGSRLKRILTLNLNIGWCQTLRMFFKIKSILRTIKPDILHLHTLYFPMPAGAFSRFHPLVISPWDGDILWTRKRPFYYKSIVHYALQAADAVTADNQIMKDKEMDYGLPKTKINVIRWYGTDTTVFKPLPQNKTLKKELHITDEIVVLSTRSLERQSNIDTIVRAISLVRKEFSNIVFLFNFYLGSQRDEIKSLISRLGVEANVRILGRLSRYEEMPAYYSISEIAVSITSPDSTPASLFEAMACGVVPVVSNEPSITEFIKDGWNGRVVDPRNHEMVAEAIVTLLKDEKLRSEIIERNLWLVKEKADFKTEMGKLEALYSGLLPGSHSVSTGPKGDKF